MVVILAYWHYDKDTVPDELHVNATVGPGCGQTLTEI